MGIEAHRNAGIDAPASGPVTPVAGGSSNSNSHNTGGGSESPQEMRELLGQLSGLLPRLERALNK